MSEYILPIQRLIDSFRRLPGIGGKTAARLAFSVLDMNDEDAVEFAEAIKSVKTEIKLCDICCNISTENVCSICADPRRDPSVICVVEDARAVMAVEKVHDFKGTYHVLGGNISPMNRVGPDDIHIAELVERVAKGGVSEIIVATNATVEGEATAMYIAKLLSPFGVNVSRLAYGIPVGGDLEYADEVTLHRAIEGRRSLN